MATGESAMNIELKTEVYRSKTPDGGGDIRMMLPLGLTKGSLKHWTATQGYGGCGWTCEGFRFAEDPDAIYPNAQGWIDPDPDPRVDYFGPVISMVQYITYTKHVLATHAVWRKLGDAQ
jgi:hypothetical protein